ncbi:hypothetical protein VPH35_034153 [Triticum aestivum]
MEVAISAVTGELVSRFISFLKNKYHSLSHAQSEKMVERLQHLLMRVSIVVEEADGRYITNSGMLLQLKMLSGAMYNGYRVLDTLRYQNLQDIAGYEKVSINDSSSSSSYLAIPFKRSRTKTEKDDKAMRLDTDGALESLEIVVANMVEFVVLLGGCERMSRRPYDVYLYTNNFLFSRHHEKQRLLNFLLGHNDSPGDHKTLVAHVCSDDRVRSRFSSILHLNGDSLLTILDHRRTMFRMTLVVIEFACDVSDDDWKKFHSFPIRISRGSKIIIISKLKTLGRFGSVQPIFLSVLSYDELRYLFKTLAFGSVDFVEHPRLVQIADEFAKELHSMQGTLVATNMYADVLRRNLDVQFWLCILDKGRRFIKRNLSIYGVHPTTLLGQGHPVDITDVALHPLSMRRYTINVAIKEELPSVTMGELLTDPNVRPKEDFIIISWESRMPPYNSFARLVTSNAQGTREDNALQGRKRRGVPM